MAAHVHYRASRAGLVRPERVDRNGGSPTPKQVRGKRWRRTSRGYYVPSDTAVDRPEQRIIQASMALRPGLAITGWAALRWRGGRWFSGVKTNGDRAPVTLLIGTRDIDAQPRFDIAVSGESISPTMYEVIDDVAVTLPTWAVSFEMRYARSQYEAAKILSLAAYDDLVSIDEMREFFIDQSSWTGIPQARDALTWAEENVWSPAEFDLGIHLYVERHRDRPLFNQPVFDLNGRHLFTPDLIDPVAGVVFEHNGPTHREAGAYSRDLHRWGLYAEHRLEAVATSSVDLADHRSLDQRLGDAYRRAKQHPQADRTWTIEQPGWWISTHTVARRRALTPEQRGRLLRYRAG